MKYFPKWSAVPAAEWPWTFFTPEEIACRGTGKLGFEPAALDKLQALRVALGVPMILNSAYRSAEHNKAVGGAADSQHMKGTAFDVSMSNHDPEVFETAARAAGFTGFGFYPKSNFIHIDTGPERTWGTPFKATVAAVTRFSEPKPVAEKPSADVVLKGLLAAIAGVLAAAPAFIEALGKLTEVAQMIATGGGITLAGALAYLTKDRLREWLR